MGFALISMAKLIKSICKKSPRNNRKPVTVDYIDHIWCLNVSGDGSIDTDADQGDGSDHDQGDAIKGTVLLIGMIRR
jgi:hypothetical protein